VIDPFNEEQITADMRGMLQGLGAEVGYCVYDAGNKRWKTSVPIFGYIDVQMDNKQGSAQVGSQYEVVFATADFVERSIVPSSKDVVVLHGREYQLSDILYYGRNENAVMLIEESVSVKMVMVEKRGMIRTSALR
jgi:hypothetical protein